MTIWELAAAVDGYNLAHGMEEEPPFMSNNEFDALLERNADWMLTVH